MTGSVPNRRAVVLLCLAGCLGGFAVTAVRGDEALAPQTSETVEPADHAPPVADDAREAEKQRKAMAGLLALCGILIVGLMFVVVVMIWGARLRRLARRELPAQKTLQNELWFLKPPKSPPE